MKSRWSRQSELVLGRATDRTPALGAKEHLLDDSRRAISRAAHKKLWKHGAAPVIGLTGCVAGGKSAVAQVLKERGSAVIDADPVGHDVLDLPAVQERLVLRFGPGVVRWSQDLAAARGTGWIAVLWEQSFLPIRRRGGPWRRSFIL